MTGWRGSQKTHAFLPLCETYNPDVSVARLWPRGVMRQERAAMHLAGDTAGNASADGRPPPAGLYLTEPARGLARLAVLPLAAPWLAAAPRGDGHGALVLPGLLASDMSTAPLRRFLRRLGYDVRGWDLGRNLGPTDAVLDGLPRALADLAGRTGGPVSVVGWSLGGIYARELARQRPGQVREVITLGSPFALTDPRQSRADGAYRRHSSRHAGRRAAAHAGPGGAADQRSVHGRLLPAGRHRVLAGVRRAGNGGARERRGSLRPPRVRHRPGNAVADRRPARGPGRAVAPVPPATAVAPALPAQAEEDRCSS